MIILWSVLIFPSSKITTEVLPVTDELLLTVYTIFNKNRSFFLLKAHTVYIFLYDSHELKLSCRCCIACIWNQGSPIDAIFIDCFAQLLLSPFDSVFVASMNMKYDHRRISIIQSRYKLHTQLHEQADKQTDSFR